jgi:anaerobic selenocysteine-containing dehydrogenase
MNVDPSVSRTPIPDDATDLPTVCVLCSHNCGLRVDVEGGRITEVRADKSHPITQGYVCNKGFQIGHYVNHDQRLEAPLRRRKDGSFERISWESAIREIAEKLSAAREISPRSVALIGIGGQANHMDGPFGLTFLGAVGSKRWFNSFAQEKTQHFLIDSWMFDTPPSVWFHPDIDNTRYLLALGTNPRISNRGHNATDTFKRLVDDKNRKLVVADPRETETTRGADVHLRVKPGSDVSLLLGMAATLVESEGLVDAEFLKTKTRDFEILRKALADVDVDEMARRCGLTRDEIVTTAREYANAESAAIMWDLAVEQIPFLTLVSYLIRVLSVLTGNVGKPGGNQFLETAAPPELSPKRFEEPVRTVAAGIRGISAVGGAPMFSPTLVPEEIRVDHPDRIRAVIVEGSNPILSHSDAPAWREARELLDLLVVIEPTMTETAELADYVLPTPVGYEKWEVCGFPRRAPQIDVQLRPPVVAPRGEALPEPEIYARLAEAMGLVSEPPAQLFELAENFDEPGGVASYFMELQSVANGSQANVLFWGYRTLGPRLASPSLVSIWAQCIQNAFGRRDDVLRTLGSDFAEANPFELAAEIYRRILAHPEGVEIARVCEDDNLGDHIGWQDGLIRVAPERMIQEIARSIGTDLPTDPEYPLVLSSGLRTRWTANTIMRDPAWRKGRGPHCALNLSAGDAQALGISAGDAVRLSTRRGSVELPAAIDKKLSAGHVWVPNGFGARYPSGADGATVAQGVNLNEISDASDRCPITGIPHHKYTLCRVERVAPVS